MNGLTEEDAKKVVDKISKDTLDWLSDYFRYWYKTYNSLGVSKTQEFCMDHVSEIMDKKVSDLTNQEKLIMFIHIFIGDDFKPEKPETPEFTPEQLSCIQTGCGFMSLFAKTHGEFINNSFNIEDQIPLIKTKHIGDLSKPELLVLLANIKWDN